MALAYSASSALATNATSGPVSPSIPGSPTEGDVVYCAVSALLLGTTAPTIDTPTDWTLVRTGTNTTQGSISLRLSVFRRVVPSGGLSAPSITGGGNGVYAVCSLFTGSDPTTPEDATVPAANTGDSTSVTAPSVTTVTAGAIAAYFFFQLDDDGLTGPNNSTTAMYSGASYATAVGSDASMAAAYKVMASPAASGTTTVTSPGSLQFIGITVPIRPKTDVAKAGSDTVTFGLTDSAAITERTKAGSDTVTFALTDNGVAGIPVPKAGSDTVTFALTDNAAAPDEYTVVAGSDTVTFALTDSASRQVIAPVFGTWTSPAIPLPDDPIAGSIILWDATLNSGAVVVETSTDNAASWQEVTNRGPVGRLPIGSSSARAVLVRVSLSRTLAEDVSPVLHRLEVRLAIDGSVDEYCQLGRFMLNDTEVVDSPAGLVLRMTGADLSRRIARNTWDESLVIPEGTNSRDAIIAVISNRWPEATYNLASTELTTTRLFYGPGLGGGNPWQDARKIARDAGWELFLDAYGVVTSRPVPDPDVMPAVWVFEDSAHPTILDLARRMTDENTYNQVIVTGESTSNEVPVTAFWRDLDQTSRTYWDGPYGHVTKTIRSEQVRTPEQAQQVADAEGLKVKGATEIVRIDVLTCPFLESGDIIEVDRTASKTIGRFAVDGWHISIGPEEDMSLTCRRQRQ